MYNQMAGNKASNYDNVNQTPCNTPIGSVDDNGDNYEKYLDTDVLSDDEFTILSSMDDSKTEPIASSKEPTDVRNALIAISKYKEQIIKEYQEYVDTVRKLYELEHGQLCMIMDSINKSSASVTIDRRTTINITKETIKAIQERIIQNEDIINKIKMECDMAKYDALSCILKKC